ALYRGTFSYQRSDGSEIRRLTATYLVTGAAGDRRISVPAGHSPRSSHPPSLCALSAAHRFSVRPRAGLSPVPPPSRLAQRLFRSRFVDGRRDGGIEIGTPIKAERPQGRPTPANPPPPAGRCVPPGAFSFRRADPSTGALPVWAPPKGPDERDDERGLGAGGDLLVIWALTARGREIRAH